MAPEYPAENILVICPNWVGDAVMATPALRCLRRNYPRANITCLVRPYIRRVLEECPWFDELVDNEGIRDVLRKLSDKNFDLIVLMVHSFRGALLARMLGGKKRVGFTRGEQRFLLTDPIPWPRKGLKRLHIPKVDLYAEIMKKLGCEGWDDKRQELFFSSLQADIVERLLRDKEIPSEKPLAAIIPGAAYGASKHWSNEKFASVIDELDRRYGMACVGIGSPSERGMLLDIADKSSGKMIVFEEGGMDLGLLKPLMASCSLAVSTDTGPRHYAVAMETPVVVLMGPTDPQITDSDYRKTIILRQDVPCGPCQKRRCPTDHRCMELITVEHVIEACDKLIGEWGAPIGWARKLDERR